MAIEPGTSSVFYDPAATYTPPVGRLPILGKARAAIDLLRAQRGNELNQVVVRNLAQIDSNTKITAEIVAMQAQTANENTRTVDNTTKVTADIVAMVAQTANENTRTIDNTAKTNADIIAIGIASSNDTARTLSNTEKTAADIVALLTTTNNDTTKTTNDTTRITAEITALVAKTADDALRTINDTTRATNDTNKINAEMDALVLKTAAEVALLNQKTQTELAQVVDSIATGTVTGVIGKQKLLFAKQTDGFDRDAEQKLAKMMIDSYAVRLTTNGDGDSTSAGLNDAHVKAVVNKAKEGIAVVPT
jgi:Skp family chaperone for outer membrane proteins